MRKLFIGFMAHSWESEIEKETHNFKTCGGRFVCTVPYLRRSAFRRGAFVGSTFAANKIMPVKLRGLISERSRGGCRASQVVRNGLPSRLC